MIISHNYDGLLFIGDPHLSSKRIGRRIDNYMLTSLNKLAQSLMIAKKHNLAPIILGDLFHKADDTNPRLLTPLLKLLANFQQNIIDNNIFILVGNHDIKDTVLTPDTALATVKASKLAYIMNTTEPIIFENLCVLHPIPYGFDIPDEVGNSGNLPNIVITHHNFDFGLPVKDIAIPLKPIKNAVMVVNGHLHITKKPKIIDNTVYANIGNIIRLTIDTIDYIPSVFVWQKDKPNTLSRIPLKHQPKELVFDFTGRNVETATELYTSNFVEALKTDLTNNLIKTQDGSVIKEEIDRISVEEGINPQVVNIMYELLKEATEKN